MAKRTSKFVDSDLIEMVEKYVEVMEVPDADKEIEEFIIFNELCEKIKAGEPVAPELAEIVTKLKNTEVDMINLSKDIDSTETPTLIDLLKKRIPAIAKFTILMEGGMAIEITFNKPKDVEMTVVYAVDQDGNKVWFDKISNTHDDNSVIHI